MAILKCKVCGKEYEGCCSVKRTPGFRWQDVACSPEHGSIYLARVEASRAPKPVKEDLVEPVETKLIIDDYEIEEDEDEEDEDEDYTLDYFED